MARRLFLSEFFVLGLTVLLLAALAPFTSGLLKPANLLNVLGYLLPLFIVASGMTVVMITGGIDLSVGAVIGLTSVVGAKLMTGGGSLLVGVPAMLALGALVGAANGGLVAWLRLPPFLATLATMMLTGGFAVWFTQSKNIYDLPDGFLMLGKSLPCALAVTGVVAVGIELILRRTIWGRWLHAVGHNVAAAHISGTPTRGITIFAYVTAGLCAGAASILMTGRLETGSPVIGREILLDAIGATVIGGASLFGGKGRIVWTFCGVLFLAVLDNALNLLNLSQF
jgi:ribose/xylose/arabinose/galactoside ABC-type transport system permease subunit